VAGCCERGDDSGATELVYLAYFISRYELVERCDFRDWASLITLK
jgi:hypothetical protein